MRVDKSNFEILQKVSQITLTDYNIYWKDAENIDGYIETESLVSMLEDLICEINSLGELIKEMKNKDNEPDFHSEYQDQCLEEKYNG